MLGDFIPLSSTDNKFENLKTFDLYLFIFLIRKQSSPHPDITLSSSDENNNDDDLLIEYDLQDHFLIDKKI